jgi:hypothetical protein
VQLLNSDGEVVASTRTDLFGRFRFTQFTGTGDYEVQVIVPSVLAATTVNPQSFLISAGNASAGPEPRPSTGQRRTPGGHRGRHRYLADPTDRQP